MENKIYDVIIIGAGPAGMTAAIYAGRAGKTVALIDKEGFGGNIAKSPKVENIPGFVSISGTDFAINMFNQVTALPTVEHIINEVALLKYYRGLIKVICSDNLLICGKSLIIATGTEYKKLNLPTKDIYYCVTCDGPMFKGKDVFVVGSGNSGAVYALELATYCKNVYLCDITMTLCCEDTLAKRIEENQKIHWLPNCTIKEVKHNKKGDLASVTLSTYETIKTNAIFVAIGLEPKTDFTSGLVTLNDKKFISASDNCTSDLVPNIFIAGDCRAKDIRQVTTACADGTTAALKAIKYLEGKNA